MAKLTLSVDAGVVQAAKRQAARMGTSLSRLVERYLSLLGEPAANEEAPPILRELRGAARGIPSETYRRHLERKYR